MGEGFAFKVLHDEIGGFPLYAIVKYLDGIGRAKFRGRVRFDLETFPRVVFVHMGSVNKI